MPRLSDIQAALSTVEDPEIHRPITELDMVRSVDIQGTAVKVEVLLTVAGCPMREEITARVRRAVAAVPGVDSVDVVLEVMDDQQRKALREKLRGGPEPVILFNQPGNLTRIYAIASGKGGVGKSSVTANLAAAMAGMGLSVGILDADIYGHSIPRLLAADASPNWVDGMIIPVERYGVRVMSMGPLKQGGNHEPIVWRGPRLHRIIEQLLTDVWWGDLDVLLLDLPPGTGDVAMSTAQLLNRAELLVVTTPQIAAAEVAIRAGMVSVYTNQRVAGVIENMSGLPCPHCGEVVDIFGSGGGKQVAAALTDALNTEVPLLGRIPFDVRLREGGDAGQPLVLSDPHSPAAEVLTSIAQRLGKRARGLAGMSLGLTPAARS